MFSSTMLPVYKVIRSLKRESKNMKHRSTLIHIMLAVYQLGIYFPAQFTRLGMGNVPGGEQGTERTFSIG